jgi:excisionase family DNA binding protein
MTSRIEKRMAKGSNDMIVAALKDMPAFLTKNETADLLRIDLSTVTRLIADGFIRRLKLKRTRCGRVLIPKNEIERFLSNATDD